MSSRWLVLASTAILSLALSTPGTAQSSGEQKWVGTWASSQMLAEGFGAYPFAKSTLREIVHISNGGPRIRVRFSNEYGQDSLLIGSAHVAVSAGGAAIKGGTDHALTFGGASSVRIPQGAAIYSDPVDLAVEPLSSLAVSIYIPTQIMRAETEHQLAVQDNFVADGDQTSAATLTDPSPLRSWYFLSGVDVPAVQGSRAVIAFGDSITDGAVSTNNANHRWPDVLAARLKQEHGLENVSVLNEGTGPSALSRIDRDILAQNGVRYLIVLESINDIGRLQRAFAAEDRVTAQTLEEGLKQIVEAAHLHGIKAFGATLTPYGGAGYSTPQGEQVREDVNNWIRTSGVFDGVVDFDQITRDSANPNKFNPAYDSGDHLHPNDAGYKAMAEGIDLSLFK